MAAVTRQSRIVYSYSTIPVALYNSSTLIKNLCVDKISTYNRNWSRVLLRWRFRWENFVCRDCFCLTVEESILHPSCHCYSLWTVLQVCILHIHELQVVQLVAAAAVDDAVVVVVVGGDGDGNDCDDVGTRHCYCSSHQCRLPCWWVFVLDERWKRLAVYQNQNQPWKKCNCLLASIDLVPRWIQLGKQK